MEDDDEFGDLYADVLRPLPSSSSAALPSAPPPPPSTSASPIPIGQPPHPPLETLTPASAAADADDADEAEDDWLLGPAPPTLDPPLNWAADEDDIEAEAKEHDVPGSIRPSVFKEEEEEVAARVSQIPDEEDDVPVIPGISAVPVAPGPTLQSKPLASDDWDSDSEDDLQIVLNETNDGQLGGGRDGIEDGDDEDGEDDLVIVTDEGQHHHLPAMEEQDWTDEAVQGGGEGERKDLGEAAKGSGAVGAAPATRIGYSNHGFHPQHHSMFKYIRPGVPSASGGSVGGAVGFSGQARPPLPSGPVAGRGRGDWRPAGGRGITNAQKGFHSGYGVSTWGSSSGRAFGSGLDFTLPPHKTVFDIEIDSFEEKPWRYPGADISDFFNFGLDEDKWKDYCKQLDQLRLEATMQSKIRVYESGRSYQEYDPDLPPELAAAAGHPNVSTDNGHHKQTDNGLVDFSGQGRGPASVRPPLPTGRAIQVEGGYGERLPSIDTRPPRMRDSDAVIEIVLQDSLDDSTVYNGAFEQTEKDFQGEHIKGGHEVEEERHAASDYANHIPHTSADRSREVTRRAPFPSEGGDILHLSTEAHSQYTPSSKMRSPVHGGAFGPRHEERLSEGTSHGRHSSTNGRNLNDIIPRKSAKSSRHDDEKKEVVEGIEINETSGISLKAGAAKELSIEDRYNKHDDKLALDESIEVEGEDITSEFRMSIESPSDDNLVHSGKRQKLCSQVEQPAFFDNGVEDEVRTPHSDSSKAKSWSSKDSQHRPERGEIKRDGGSRRASDLRRHHAERECNDHRKNDYNRDTRVEMDRSRMASKEREDIFQPGAHRDWKTTTHAVHGQSLERSKETKISQRREDNVHSKRVGDEDTRQEYSAEAGARRRNKVRPTDSNGKNENLQLKKRVDEEDWRQLRQSGKDEIVMSHHESLDDSHIKIKKNEENSRIGKSDKEDILHGYRGRDHSSRRKRERVDAIDERRREANGRMRDKAEDYYPAKQKDDSWHSKEREHRQRPKQSYENILTHREREERRTIRSGRVVEDEPLVGSSRNKDDLRSVSFDKDYQGKDRRRQNELANRNRIGEENVMKLKGPTDVHPRDKHLNNDERNLRHERLSTHNDRPSSMTDSHQARSDRQKESMRKRKGSENNGKKPQGPSKRRHEDHNDKLNEKVEKKGTTGQQNRIVSSTILSKKSNNQIPEQPEASQLNHSFVKQREADAASDNDNQEDSRRGRSKLERWTSNKERDYSIIDNKEKFSTSVRPKEIEASNVTAVHGDEVAKPGSSDAVGNSDLKVGDTRQIVDKLEVQDPHLDTVAKLKRRSERFKLPMPGEKESSVNRRVDNESQLPQNENAVDVEVKPERPARKRRWTGS
ncbi:FIP1[V]-like protein [Typha angustifolia]|uniref:FIP1[V]-like protein n=1 Tax=Typha angustifolia TaxID=59011 RepID=UPI003C2FDEFB